MNIQHEFATRVTGTSVNVGWSTPHPCVLLQQERPGHAMTGKEDSEQRGWGNLM